MNSKFKIQKAKFKMKRERGLCERSLRGFPCPLLVLLILGVVFTSGCSFSGIGSDLGRGLTDGLSERSDSIGAGLGSGLIRSIRDTLVSERTRSGLTELIDSVITVAGLSANRGAVGLRDSLLSVATRDWLLALERDLTSDLVLASAGISENLLGDRTRQRIRSIRNELLGAETMMFVAALRDTLLGPRMREQIALLRDELLGPETRAALDSLLLTATDRLQAVTREEGSFLQRNITAILWTAGGIIGLLMGLAGFIFARGKRYRKMLETVTLQIHQMTSRQAYDDLTNRIQMKAQEEGIERKFRQFLEGQGLQGDGSWLPEKM